MDGRGNIIPIIDPNIPSLRVVEMRRRFHDYRIRGGLVVVLGTCDSTQLHQRYVCLDILQLRNLLKKDQSLKATTTTLPTTNQLPQVDTNISLLTEEVSSLFFFKVTV